MTCNFVEPLQPPDENWHSLSASALSKLPDTSHQPVYICEK